MHAPALASIQWWDSSQSSSVEHTPARTLQSESDVHALDKSGTHLYSANEISDYQGKKSGSVSAYSVNKTNGHLTLMNTVSSEGAGPAHLSLHPAGKQVLVANYYGGTVAVLPILPNGSLGAATEATMVQLAPGEAK